MSHVQRRGLSRSPCSLGRVSSLSTASQPGLGCRDLLPGLGALAAGASCPQPLEFGFGRGRKEASAEHSSTLALRTGKSGGFPSAGEPAGIDSLPAGLRIPLSCSEGDPELSSAGRRDRRDEVLDLTSKGAPLREGEAAASEAVWRQCEPAILVASQR